ncbi:MAG: hypothetical protein OJF62_000313 [Pseudolabrys sp.]|jgi:hypothetical protein|nr:hypothetical protein [Pseudolabrys sp.]
MPLINEPTAAEQAGAYVGIIFSALCYLAVVAILIAQFA